MNNLDVFNNKSYVLLILVLFLGLMVRLPGIFWGLQVIPKERFICYNPDEERQVSISQEFLTKTINRKEDHPKGFGFQIFLAAVFLKSFVQMNTPKLILTGRLLTLAYGLLTIFLLYFLSNEIFKNKYIALFSSLFLALSGLHVTQSHFATVDVGTTFWMYATLYFSLLYKDLNKNIYLALAVVSAGLALAFKLAIPVLIPLIYVLYEKKIKFFHSFLCLAGVVTIFIAANGGYYTLANLKLSLIDVIYKNNLCVYQHHNKWGNLFFYLVGLLPSLGLANFIFLLTGAFFFNKELSQMILNKNIFIIVLPLTVYGILICSLDLVADRYFLPLVPLLGMLSGYGLYKIKQNLPRAHFFIVLTIIVLYQLAYVIGEEYYYVFDTRQAAREWIIKEIPKGETIHLGRYAAIPNLKQYKVLNSYNSDYLVLHETGYLRYLPPRNQFSNTYPHLKDIYHANPLDFFEIQEIFRGESSFALVKSFPIMYITPENILYKKLFGVYSNLVGDTLIFKRK